MAEGDDTSFPYIDEQEPAMDRGDGKGAETTPPPIPSRPHHQQDFKQGLDQEKPVMQSRNENDTGTDGEYGDKKGEENTPPPVPSRTQQGSKQGLDKSGMQCRDENDIDTDEEYDMKGEAQNGDERQNMEPGQQADLSHDGQHVGPNSSPQHEYVKEKCVYDIKEAWNELKFSVWNGRNNFMYDASSDIKPYLLQFAMDSKHAKIEFAGVLYEGLQLKVSEPGFVHVDMSGHGTCTERECLDTVITCVSKALQGKIAMAESFNSSNELQKVLSSLNPQTQQLLDGEIVGIYIKKQEKTCVAYIVGNENVAKRFTQQLKIADHLCQQNKAVGRCRSILQEPKEVKFKKEAHTSLDEIHYLDAIHFKTKVTESYPDVNYKENETTIEIWSGNEQQVRGAYSLLSQSIRNIQRKELQLSPPEIWFLNEDNVEIHINKQLRKIHAYMAVSQKVIILGSDENVLSIAEQRLQSSLKVTKVEGTLPEEVKKSYEENNSNKIKIYDETPEEKIVCYTKDKTETANEVIALIEGNKIWKKDRNYGRKTVEGLIHLGIISDLQKSFPDVKVNYLEDGNTVTVKSPNKKDQECVLEQLDAMNQNIQWIQMSQLPRGAEKLLLNQAVLKYVQGKVKIQKIKFVENEQLEVQMVCLTEETKERLYESVKKCFLTIECVSEYCKNASVVHFLHEYRDQIYRDSPKENVTYLCFTDNLHKMLLDSWHKRLYELQLFHKMACDVATEMYLKNYGSTHLQAVEKKHNVKFKAQDGHVGFKGHYDNAQKAIFELNRMVKTAVIHLGDGERIQHFLAALDGKTKVDELVDQENSCWEKICYNKHEQLDCHVKGVECFAKWQLHKDIGTIIVGEADFRVSEFDVVIIPVSTCRFGEDFLSKERKEILYIGSSDRGKLKLGEPCELKHEGKNFVALAVVDTAVERVTAIQKKICVDNTKLEVAIKDITTCYAKTGLSINSFTTFYSKKGVFTVGFAFPCRMMGFANKIGSILSGFQQASKQLAATKRKAELYLCVSAECGSIIKEVDNTLKGTSLTRRKLSPKFVGIFREPKVNTDITREPLLDIKAECLAVAVAPDMDLAAGYISAMISKVAGPELQIQLNKNRKLEEGEYVVADSMQLAEKGIKKLIFGNVPPWNNDGSAIKMLQEFVENCLLKADEQGCTSVAFPALGTGKLGYPQRDVVSALLDGIDAYTAHTLVGNVSTVHISTPKIKKNESMFLLLSCESNKRQYTAEESSIRKQEDVPFLTATSYKVTFSIVVKETLRSHNSCSFVDITFNVLPDMPPGAQVPMEIDSSEWKMTLNCKNSKDCLKSVILEVIKKCEKLRITSINVFCNKDFNFTEDEQADVVFDTVVCDVESFYTPQYIYLKHVRVATSKTGFNHIAEEKLNAVPSKGPLQSLLQKRDASILIWKKGFHPRSKMSMNILLAGGEDSDIARVKEDLKDLLTSQANMVQTDKEVDEKGVDEVSAELNPGIVKYLQDLPSECLEKWEKKVQHAFGIDILWNEHQAGVTVKGSYENIIELEDYLETDFPGSPRMDENEAEVKKLSLHEHYYEQSQALTVTAEEKEMTKKSSPNKIEENASSLSFDRESIEKTCLPEVMKKTSTNVPLPEESSQEPTSSKSHSREPCAQKKTGRLVMMKKSCFPMKRLWFTSSSLRVELNCQDITTVDTDCIVSAANARLNNECGVAKAIAKQVGPLYSASCKSSVESYGELEIGDCRETNTGCLPFKYILQVCCPMKWKESNQVQQYQQIRDSVVRCLERADQLGMKSIAIPFISTGVSGFPVEHCVQEYFRAVTSFERQMHLEFVMFVDIDEKKVSIGSQQFALCLKACNTKLQTASITYDTINRHTAYEVGCCNIESCDAVVLREDETFSGKAPNSKYFLENAGHTYQAAYGKHKGKLHDIGSVEVLTHHGETGKKFVFLAVVPALKKNQLDYLESLSTTIRNVLRKAKELNVSSIALHITDSGGDAYFRDDCSRAMIDSILKFQTDEKSHLKKIQIATNDDESTSAVFRELVYQLEQRRPKGQDKPVMNVETAL